MATPPLDPSQPSSRPDRSHNGESDINVSDLLRLALPLETRLAGNSSEPRRYVKWVAALIDWDAVEEQVQPNDLVLVPAALQRRLAGAAARTLLRPLAEMPVAAVVFFDTLPPELEKALTDLQLTALLAPPQSSLRDIHEAVALLLVDRQKATSERALQLYRQLSTMSREGMGLEAMTTVMSNLTGKIVAVQDKRLDVIASSWPAHVDDDYKRAVQAALEQRDVLPPVLRNRKAAAKARQSVWQMVLPIENLGRLISPIISGDRARGYLSVIGPAAELDMFDSLTVEHGAAACALEMAKVKAVSEAKKALRGDFLEGLLTGTMPIKEIERLEGRLDHNTREPHAVMVLSWLTPDISLRRLETAVHWVLSNHPRPALAHIYGNQYLVVFQALKSAEDMDSAHQLGRRIYEQVEDEFPGAQLIGGISGPAHALADWPATYDEALQAMQLSRRLKLTNQFVQFSSLGIYRLLYGLENQPDVRQFAEDIMRPLAEYDQQNRGSLVKTVEAYFSHHGNISQTAESLFVHRNTLLYRMDRIQELTGLQLDQANMRLALHLALRLWQLRPDNEPDTGQL